MEILIVVVLAGVFIAINLNRRSRYRYRRPRHKTKYNTSKNKNNKIMYSDKKMPLNKKSEDIIPWGEQLLLKELTRNFNIFGKDAVVWHGLEYRTEKSFRQVDFLVLSQKGLFILESKYWRGISFIFDGEIVSLFENTMYHSFGQAKEEVIKTEMDSRFRVFNAQFNNEEGRMLLQTHQNPVVQVRNYARALSRILTYNNIKSVVVFSTNDKCELRYNRQPLNEIKTIDKYTTILLDKQLIAFFQNLPLTLTEDELNRIKNIVESKLSYQLRLDEENIFMLNP